MTLTPARTALLALILSAAPALAREPLNKEAHINSSLIAAKTADILRDTCPTLKARMVVALSKGKDLENYARAKGYTEDEVKAFLKDKAERARVRGASEAYLAKQGAVVGNPESYCVVGRDEIARKTLIGSLLRSTE